MKNKQERAEIAKQHTREMEKLYSTEIMECITHTDIYGGEDKIPVARQSQKKPKFWFFNADSVSTAMISKAERKAILNFASYRKPGGGFINGSMAQEEALCHESYLYNVLGSIDTFYAWNNGELNNSLYTDRALYSPKVRFIRGDKQMQCDVLTCAAPNKTAALRNGLNPNANDEALLVRLKFIKAIAEEHQLDTLILGAFGCGVFGQNPDDIAHAMKFVFHYSDIKSVVFAVPGDDINAQTFRKHFPEVIIKGN